jgi:hypothetical protein
MSGLTDRELLEGAARAAGIEIVNCTCSYEDWPFKYAEGQARRGHWNPLTVDGDALRLMHAIYRKTHPDHWIRIYDNLWSGSLEDMRRAVVRAAYEIGRAKPHG